MESFNESMIYDLAIINGKVFNVYLKRFEMKHLLIHQGKCLHLCDEMIYEVNMCYDAKGNYVVPGFVDCHMHVESSMMMQSTFSDAVLLFGTTTVVSDPHELANVYGMNGLLELMNQETVLDIYYGIPSSVPSTHTNLETTGGVIEPDDIRTLALHPKVRCLGEVMNDVDLTSLTQTKTKDIVEAFKCLQPFMPVEGHCPAISGFSLSKFIAAGVTGDHTHQTAESLLEKISMGMFIELQLKSISKEIIDIINQYNLYEHIAFVTDDVMPDDLMNGHLNRIYQRAIDCGLSIEHALYCSTYTPAKRMLLHDLGALAPGKIADVIIASSVSPLKVEAVFKKGELVVSNGKLLKYSNLSPMNFTPKMNLNHMMKQDFEWNLNQDEVKMHVMSIQTNTTFIKDEVMIIKVKDGLLDYASQGLCMLSVFDRYGGKERSRVLVKHALSKQGALATTWAHDHHQLMVLGNDTILMARAANRLIECSGGMVALNADYECLVPLPIGGIISDQPVDVLGDQVKQFKLKMEELGYQHDNPIMSFCTLGLPVSPTIKLTNKGLIDVIKKQLLEVIVDD